MKKPISCAIVATVSALTVLSGLETVSAGPLPVGTAGLKAATVSDVVDVRYRRHRHHRRNDAIAASIMFGLLSAAIASRYYDDDYYDYDYPSYGYYGGHYRGHHGGHHPHYAHAHHGHHHRH